MKRKLYITLGIVVVILAAAVYYLLRPASPSKTETLANRDLEITVAYSAPYKKGRLIFGPVSEGALVPYGQYWRLGANKATQITLNKAARFNDKELPAGTYRMYAIPGENSWEVVLNSEVGKSGSEEPDHSKDILTTTVASAKVNSAQEQFTINLQAEANGIKMTFVWDTTSVDVLINVN
jgi:Protein of unknown function (DUF2911)